jgi:hypothetical protein
MFDQFSLREDVSLRLGWLTITGSSFTIRGLKLTCRIQVSGNATIHAYDCTFETIEDAECSVEILANSKGTFERCLFPKSRSAAVVLRHDSAGTFSKCQFKNEAVTSILARAKSSVEVRHCRFEGALKFAVYLHERSVGRVIHCQFLNMPGKGILILKGSCGEVSDCHFADCEAGGILASGGATVVVRRSMFRGIARLAFHAVKSIAELSDCAFHDCRLNGVYFEWSSGFARDCLFSRFTSPAIVVTGENANPVIADCRVSDCTGNAVVARDAAYPVFARVTVDGATEAAFVFSDWVRAVVVGCVVIGVAGPAFSVFNGADARVFESVVAVSDDSPAFSVVTFGRLRFAGVCFSGNRESVAFRVEHNGDFDCGPSDARLAARGVTSALALGQGRLVPAGPSHECAVSVEYEVADWPVPAPLPVRSARGRSSVPVLAAQNPPPAASSVAANRTIQRGLASAPPPPPPAAPPPRPVRALPRPDTPPQRPLPVSVLCETVIAECPRPTASAWFCLQCGRPLADSGRKAHLCSPCGHLAICSECAVEAVAASEAGQSWRCPVCATVISATTELFALDECPVCADRVPDTAFLPCGHHACYECAMKLWDPHTCPVCNKRFTSIRRQFPL